MVVEGPDGYIDYATMSPGERVDFLLFLQGLENNQVVDLNNVRVRRNNNEIDYINFRNAIREEFSRFTNNVEGLVTYFKESFGNDISSTVAESLINYWVDEDVGIVLKENLDIFLSERITSELIKVKSDWEASLINANPTSDLDKAAVSAQKAWAGLSGFDFSVAYSLTDWERYKIYSFLKLPNSQATTEINIAEMTNTDDLSLGVSTSVLETALDDFNSLLSVQVTDDGMKNMLTFESRVKYLAALTQFNPSEYGVNENVYSLIYENVATSLFFPVVPYFTSSRIMTSINSEAYIALLATVNELSYYSTVYITKIAPYVKNQDYASLQLYLQGLLSVRRGLDFLYSNELETMWNKELDLGEELSDFNSLAKVYTSLANINVFDSLANYDVSTIGKPFKHFFDVTSSKLSSDILEGISLSAMYVPMKTSTYDPMTINLSSNEDFINGFHYNFGFHRKALYIDTNVEAAVDYFNTGRTGALRVATLKDLMNADKDIVLYLDDNFYNLFELADMRDVAISRLDNIDAASDTGSWLDQLWTKVKDTFTTSIYELFKSAEKQVYSQFISSNVAEYNESGEQGLFPFNGILLSTNDIKKYLSLEDDEAKQYSVLQSAAVVSGIYRDKVLFSKVQFYVRNPKPIFMSSPVLPTIETAEKIYKNTIFNYALLKNLEANMPIGYNLNLDMTSPLYMDIYGNILTESGVVVIPAASNATLHTANYKPYNTGFLSFYGDSYKIPADFNNVDSVLSDMMAIEGDYWEIKQITAFSGDLDVAELSTQNLSTLSALKSIYSYDLTRGGIDFSRYINNILEVLRGAPIENINKIEEGLNVGMRLTQQGLLMAYKLEQLIESLKSGTFNTNIKIPNFAFMDGIEYIVLFVYKLIMLFIIIIWMITIYLDAAGNSLSFRTIFKCLGVLLLVVSVILLVPTVFDLTYYEANKYLLQEEASYLQMLNLEKRESGNEIGVVEVTEPEIATKMYLKLDSLDMHWIDLFGDILSSSTFKSLEDIYAAYNENHFAVGQEGIETVNDGLYVSTDTLFDSTFITFDPGTRNIYQVASTGTPASFYSPYYAFIDALLWNVNNYNRQYNIYAYTTKIQKGGRIKTVGNVSAYFNSLDFMEGELDVLGLYELYDITPSVDWAVPIYSPLTIANVGESQWCNRTIREEQIIKRIDLISNHMKQYIAKNKTLIGKVTDETFIKCMALDLALYHNKIFNTQSADCLEIYEVSNEDLIRLSMAHRDVVMRQSPTSFSRFVLETGGTPAIYIAAILYIITFLGSFIKPLAVIAVFILVMVSIFVFKLLLRKENKSYFGYVCTVLLICFMNFVNSIFNKLSMYLPSLQLSTTVCLLIQIVIQVTYLFLLVNVIIIAAKDWRNIGFSKHSSLFERLIDFRDTNVSTLVGPKQANGWDYYNTLMDRQAARLNLVRER
jgi:hypothetical protein